MQAAVRSREGVSLWFEVADGVSLSTVILAQDNKLRPLVDRQPMSVLASVRKADELASAHGFQGYEIRGIEDLDSLPLRELSEILEEVNRQAAARSNFTQGDPVTGHIQGGFQLAGIGIQDLDRLRTKLVELTTSGKVS
jgi:hypothetical protein